MIEIKHLSKTFQMKDGAVNALKDIDLTIPDGSIYGIIGMSGAGKSTLVRCINLLERPTEGSVVIDGTAMETLSPAALRERRRDITMIFQQFNLLMQRSCLKNICFPMEIQRIPKKERIRRAEELAEMVHITPYLKRKPAELSGGQQQRVAIARALSKRPDVLLLDEPLSNLDAKLRVEMREEIRRIQREAGITTVFVTHDQEEASSIADRVVLLRDGVLQQEDTARGLYENPVNLFAADFLGTPPINQLHGIVQNGRLVLDGGIPAALALPDGLAEGQEIVLAVRAESILPQGDTPAFRTTVLERYSLGKDELVRLQAGPAELRGLVPAELEILPGAELAVGLKKRGVFLFDAKTGVRYL